MTPGPGSRRHRGLRLRDERHEEAMILQILSDPAQVAYHWNAVAPKLRRIADTRQHEQVGRLDDPGAEDGFLVGQDVILPAFQSQPNARAASSRERERGDARTGQDGQVLSIERWEQVAMDDAEALTVLGIEVHVTSAITYRRADIIEYRLIHLLAR